VEDGSDVLFEQLSTPRTWGRLQLGNNQQVFGSWMKCTGWSPLWGLPRLPSSMPFCRVFTKAYMRCHFAGQSKILSQPTLSTVWCFATVPWSTATLMPWSVSCEKVDRKKTRTMEGSWFSCASLTLRLRARTPKVRIKAPGEQGHPGYHGVRIGTPGEQGHPGYQGSQNWNIR
jgi:hypothetical protein